MNALQVRTTSTLSKAYSAKIPSFKFEQSRWAVLRSENVDNIAANWIRNPNRVLVLSDKKFGAHSMVMMRKEDFEQLHNVVTDLMDGEATIRTNFSAMMTQIELLRSVVQTQEHLPKVLQLAVESLTGVWAQIQSTVEVSAPRRKIRPATLSAEELAAIGEED